MNKIIFISDVHLGSKGSNPKELYKLLNKEQPQKIFIVGDFIDGWLLKKRFHWTKDSTDVIRKILSYSNKGTEVVYITGNHDDFLRSYSPLNFGNIKIVDEWEWNGYLITHGDLYDGIVQLKWLGIIGSYGYELALAIDRGLKRLGYKKSFSKMTKDKVKSAVKFITDFERQLAYQAHSRGLKGVICGHIHKPENKKIKIKNKTIHYLNCGDWIENNSYISYNKKIKLNGYYKQIRKICL
jgi:UDP-2,3-diacylglucosamine pyrophosphatase LpxH